MRRRRRGLCWRSRTCADSLSCYHQQERQRRRARRSRKSCSHRQALPMNVDPAPHMIGHEMLVVRGDSIGREP